MPGVQRQHHLHQHQQRVGVRRLQHVPQAVHPNRLHPQLGRVVLGVPRLELLLNLHAADPPPAPRAVGRHRASAVRCRVGVRDPRDAGRLQPDVLLSAEHDRRRSLR